MIERICDDRIVRVDRTGFRGEWGYAGGQDEGQLVLWHYHANAQHVDTGAGAVLQSAPDAQQPSPAGSTRSVGSDAEPNTVLTPSLYWPNTRWRLTGVVLDKWLTPPHRQAAAWWWFEEPLAPEVSVSRDSAVLTFTIKSRASEMGPTTRHDRVRTRWWLQAITSGSFPEPARYGTGGWSGEFSGEERTLTYDATTLSPGTPVAVRLCAVNDGMSGASAVACSEVHVFAVPAEPTVSLKPDNSSVVATVRTNATWWRPLDRLVLQRQVAARRDPGGSWANVLEVAAGAASTTTIADRDDARLPGEDKATWYRVAAWHDDASNVSYGYVAAAALMSAPKAPSVKASYNADDSITAEVTVGSQMDVATYVKVSSGTRDLTGWVRAGEGDNVLAGPFDPKLVYRVTCKSVTAAAALDGRVRESAVAVADDVRSGDQAEAVGALLSPVEIASVALNPGGDGLTLSLSWGAESLGGADVSELGTLVEWTDAPGGWESTVSPSSHKVVTAPSQRSCRLSVDGLSEGVPYRIRVRRYATVGGEDGHGPEATAVATPWSTPSAPVLSAPASVAAGDGVEYSWTFSDEGDTPQTAARLHVGGEVHEVEGSLGSHVLATDASQAGSTLSAWVEVCCGGGWSEASNEARTLLASLPTCAVSPAGAMSGGPGWGGLVLGALPLRLAVSGTGDRYDVTVTAAREAEAPAPDGGRRVARGQVVGFATATGNGTVEVPSDLLVGGGAYDVEVVPGDTATGLIGPAARLSFNVAWGSPAATPSGEVSVEGGVATVVPLQGEGARGDEACRIWRVTADGPRLALDGAAWGEPAVDRWPPYGWDGCAYVVEAVTPDGDSSWASAPYAMDSGVVSVDWAGGSAELPFGLALSSSWSGSFERRAHLDGTRAGFWQAGVDRDWSASGQLPEGDARLEGLMALARRDGPCLVRAPGGVAIVANVDVSEELPLGHGAVSVTLSAQEVGGWEAWAMEAGGEEG